MLRDSSPLGLAIRGQWLFEPRLPTVAAGEWRGGIVVFGLMEIELGRGATIVGSLSISLFLPGAARKPYQKAFAVSGFGRSSPGLAIQT